MEEIFEKFYIGMYSKIINESKINDEEIEFIILRSRILLDQTDFVINYIKTKNLTSFYKVILLLANSKKIINQNELINFIINIKDEENLKSIYYKICKSILYLQVEMISEALSLINDLNHPEIPSIKIQCYLKLNRIDLAEKELLNIKNDVLKSITNSFISLFKNKESIQTSLFILQDLSERFELTPLLANLISNCYFALGEFENGQMILNNLIEKFPNDISLQINNSIAIHRNSDYDKIQNQINLILNNNNNFYNFKLKEFLKDFDETIERIQKE